LALLPKKRQNLMFSATFSDDIRALAKGLVHDPIEIDVSPRNSTARSIKQWLIPVDKKSKPALLCSLVHDHNWQQVLVFTRTKHGANRLTSYLHEQKISAAAIHGNKSQGARTRALADFKAGDIRVLVATDIAARGLDIEQLPHVVNYELPNVPADYVHRIGRTGRAGATGETVALVCAEELEDLENIEGLIGHSIEREEYPGFKPQTPLPESRPKAPRQPKKIKAKKSPRAHTATAPARKPQGQSQRPWKKAENSTAKPHTPAKKPSTRPAKPRQSGNV
jgi:ATP-dependent RNA helicase RhlE